MEAGQTPNGAIALDILTKTITIPEEEVKARQGNRWKKDKEEVKGKRKRDRKREERKQETCRL